MVVFVKPSIYKPAKFWFESVFRRPVLDLNIDNQFEESLTALMEKVSKGKYTKAHHLNEFLRAYPYNFFLKGKYEGSPSQKELISVLFRAHARYLCFREMEAEFEALSFEPELKQCEEIQN